MDLDSPVREILHSRCQVKVSRFILNFSNIFTLSPNNRIRKSRGVWVSLVLVPI